MHFQRINDKDLYASAWRSDSMRSRVRGVSVWICASPRFDRDLAAGLRALLDGMPGGTAADDRALLRELDQKARKNLIKNKSFELADYIRKAVGPVGSGEDYYKSGR